MGEEKGQKILDLIKAAGSWPCTLNALLILRVKEQQEAIVLNLAECQARLDIWLAGS